MYCYKCGNQIPENGKFCAVCGSPAVDSRSAAGETAAPEKENRRKPKTGLWIALATAGTVVLTGIIVLVIVISSALGVREINLGDYVTFKFEESKCIVDGYINGSLEIDKNKAYNDIVTDKDSMTKSEFEQYFFTYLGKTYEKQSTETPITYEAGPGKILIKQSELEQKCDVRFKSDISVQINLADEAKSQGLTIEKPEKMNFFDYIDKCYYNTGIVKNNVSVNLESKNFKHGDYKIKVLGFYGEYGGDDGSITVMKGENVCAFIDIISDKTSGREGDKAQLSFDYKRYNKYDNLLDGTPFLVDKDTKDYKLKAEQPITTLQAQARLTEFRKMIKSSVLKDDIFIMDRVYRLTAKNNYSNTVNMIVVLYTSTSTLVHQDYYHASIMKNVYIDEREKSYSKQLKYLDYDFETDTKSMSSLWNTLKRRYGGRYKINRIY